LEVISQNFAVFYCDRKIDFIRFKISGKDIMFDDNEPTPARVIHALGLQKKVNLLSGAKLIGVNQLESMLETNIAIAGEVDPRVVNIETQPLTFDLNTGREYALRSDIQTEVHERGYKPWIYTPDFRFTLSDGTQIFLEGKGARWLEKHQDFEGVIAAVRGLGHKIVLVTEAFFSKDLVRNLRLLKPLVTATGELLEWPHLQLLEGQPVSAKHLLLENSMTQRQLFLGLLTGLFHCDLSAAPLGPKAMIGFGNGETSHLEVLPL
jgi:hypothetical protein